MPTSIALFGATGRTGQRFLEQALAQGHTIRALVRDPAKLTQSAPQLTVIRGDVLDPASVRETVAGTELVVSLFGHVKGSPEWLHRDGTRHIVEAMQAEAVGRIISLSGGGLPYEKDEPKFADRAIRFIMRLAVPKVLNDAIAHAEVLRESDRQWVIARAPRLTDGPRKGDFRVGWVGVNASTQIGRADLATFLLHLVDDTSYDGGMPFVSY